MSVLETNITAEIQSLSPYGRLDPLAATPIGAEELRKIETYWRPCNYLSLGMIYLQEKPLLVEALRPEHIKKPASWALGIKPGTFVYL